MITVLFLDDSQTRHNFFCGKQHPETARWNVHTCKNDVYRTTHVYTAQQAIDQLKKFNFDIISLDHDLTINSPEENNGYVVAQFMCEHYKEKEEIEEPRVFIHSWNRGRREAMIKLLQEHGFHCYLTHFFVA